MDGEPCKTAAQIEAPPGREVGHARSGAAIVEEGIAEGRTGTQVAATAGAGESPLKLVEQRADLYTLRL